MRDDHLFRGIEGHAFTFHDFGIGSFLTLRDVVQTEYHVLRRQGDRRTVLRVENVVRRQHQQLCFQDRGVAQRHVYRHLVTVKVSVERRTHQRVQLDRFTFHQFRLECLDGETVKGRSTVKHHRVTFQYVFQDVPNHRFLPVYQLLSRFHGFYDASFDELTDNERFEQFRSHIFRKAAFMQFQLRTYNDNGTTGVVHTFTEKVLTETALLAFQYVGE